MTTERRLHSRKIPPEFTFIQIEQEFGGRVLNFSKEGLSFETSAPICDSDMVQFWLSFRRHGQVDGYGRIAWLNEKKNLGGIAFVHLSRASRQRIAEWSEAIAEHEAESVRIEPQEEESPEHVVSEIMERVLRERRKAPAEAPPVVSHPESTNDAAAGAPAEEAENTKQPEPASSEAVTPPPPGAAAEEFLDSANADRAVSSEARDADSSEEPHRPLPTVFTPAPQNFDLWNMTGSGEPRLPFTSPARNARVATSSGGMAGEATPILEAAAVAECGPVDDWNREAALSSSQATTASIEESEPSANTAFPPEETKESVPLKQYLYARRAQFLRGALIGAGFSVVMAIAIFTFWKPAERGAAAEGTRNAVSANSLATKENTAPAPAPPPVLTEESKGAASSPQEHAAISTGKPRAIQPNLPVAGDSSPAAGSGTVASVNTASTSEEGSAGGATNAVPRPTSFAGGNSGAENGSQPIFQLPQPGNTDENTGAAEPWNAQSKVEVSLGSTPWTFRRRNIHGAPPVGGEVRPPEVLAQVAPRYPELAKTQGISGEVVIDALIDARGNIRKAEVISGPMALRSAAVSAVLLWKYKPALLDGKPTEVHEKITLKFVAK